ncbi:MAG: serine/threonine-protein kinase [Myxococcota bacterium]
MTHPSDLDPAARPSPGVPNPAGYELVQRLGAGGMGEIWAAVRVGSHGAIKPCVVKMIRPELAEQPRYRRLFEAEARVGMMLGHPNIVSVFDVGVVGQQLFMAMDWVDGVDLREFWSRAQQVSGRPMAVDDAVYIVGALLDALDHVHGVDIMDVQYIQHMQHMQGPSVVHHDVSPRNVMIGSRGEVKLMDFGLVGLRGDPGEGSAPGFRGTLRYLSREQARGRAEPASDLFAVGAILHELLEGRKFRHACTGEDMLMTEILLGGIPTLERTIPEPVESLRRGLLEPRPEFRVKTAARALARLEAWSEYRGGRRRLEALYREAIGDPRPGLTRLRSLAEHGAWLDALSVSMDEITRIWSARAPTVGEGGGSLGAWSTSVASGTRPTPSERTKRLCEV